ncbi:MAG: enoyl-CoA hydratase [Rhodospirillaceae bacterium]|jgi:enoyl-CoA hydratase/carnithine racemase|nr:enoyl-CoA hydratase [Rhodospirillaceae bacterium]MBT5664790.1 enoyl-CoA hydratase [Rhodospirillaceae bacterium]MBT5811591.1 enoyl-CoA hydratase [Rhodospirillaceae bacterium]
MTTNPDAADQDTSQDTGLLRQDDAGVCTLTLNRPNARNALSLETMEALQQILSAIAKDPSVRVVVMAANGPAFCAGHDMRQLRANPTFEYYKTTFATSSSIMKTMLTMPQPIIARVHGMATAAGCQLVATCDLAIASTTAKFATPGVHIGLFCSTPMVALSRNVGRKAAMEMLMLGEPVDAARALELGLVNKVVTPDNLDAALRAMTDTLLDKSAVTLAMGKVAFYEQLEKGVVDAYAHTGEVMARNMMTADAAEGIQAFIDKRTPVWTGK